jgi:hypothetical protein
MSDITPPAGASFTSLFGIIFLVFVALYSMWYLSGGPQKESSNNAFIEQPTYQNPYNTKTYGTIEEVDKVQRRGGVQTEPEQ